MWRGVFSNAGRRLQQRARATPRHEAAAAGAGAAVVLAGAAGVATCEGGPKEVPRTSPLVPRRDPAHALDAILLSSGQSTLESPSAASLGACPTRCNRDVKSIHGRVNYQSQNVPTGLYAKGVYPPAVGVRRDLKGNDVEVYGVEVERVDVEVHNARGEDLRLDKHGAELVQSSFVKLDYLNFDEVVANYYAQCCQLVKEATGARLVVAFDHNVRSEARKGADAGGGFNVQPPLALVHGDYTEESARRRVRDLTKPPTDNDIFKKILGNTPLVDEDPERLLQGRFQIVNVWRNISEDPVQRMPLSILDPASIPNEDIIVHEIHYDDRVGENYNARHGRRHKWWHFACMNADEALLLKTWDSAGEFARQPSPGPRVPATFVFHTAFEAPVPPGAPPRESIEVRTMAFF